MTSVLKAAAAAFLLAAAGLPALAQERANTILVLDASGSMWGQIDGVNKIAIAREVVAGILADFPADQNLGLVAYGHRQRGQCSDIQTMVEPAPGTAPEIIRIVGELNPRGMTPMTDAVIAAAKALRHTEQAATVILISDGIETCHADPCAAARELAQVGIDFTTHVIGFDVSGEAEALMQMQCIAEETGGLFLTADNAQELTEALQQVVAAPPEVTLTLWARLGAPDLTDPRWYDDAADTLAAIESPVTWRVSDGDFNIVVDEVDGNPLQVTLPAGDYIVTAYSVVHETFARHEVSLATDMALAAEYPGARPEPEAVPEPVVVADEADVVLQVPAQVVAGANFTVAWQHADDADPQNYISILPSGADRHGEKYFRVKDGDNMTLMAPPVPGLYDIAYFLESGDTLIARATFEVTAAQAAISAPASVVAGSNFTVEWQDASNAADYISILPSGAERHGEKYFRVKDGDSMVLMAPSVPGLYDATYFLESGDTLIARATFEVTEAAVTLSVPGKVRAGTPFAVTWSDAINTADYISILPSGAERHSEKYYRVKDAGEMTLTAPAAVGLYDVAYFLESGDRLLARATFEVLDADAPLDDGAGLNAPATALPGEAITITWTGGGTGGDERIALARKDQPDFSWIVAVKAGEEKTVSITLPDEPGLYEVRFLDIAAPAVLGRSVVEVK